MTIMTAMATGDSIHHRRHARAGDASSRIASMTRALKCAGAGALVSARGTSSIWSSHIAEPPRAQPLFDDAPRLGDAPFDRADRHLQHRADLVVRVVAGLRQQQSVAELWRERLNLAGDPAAQLSVHDLLLGRAIGARGAAISA